VKIKIKNSTFVACSGCGMQILAPGSKSSITVSNSAFSSNPLNNGGTNFTSGGAVSVKSSHFLKDTDVGIHGASCKAKKNTPDTAICN